MPQTLRHISSRELSFFGLQAILPWAFALLAPTLYLIGYGLPQHAIAKLADGTLVLIAFTMLMSLSQDLQQAVRPYQRRAVARLELLLRVAAIVILSTYMLIQSAVIIIEIKSFAGSSVAGGPANTDGHDFVPWMEQGGLIPIALTCLAVLSFTYAVIISAIILRSLRPYFVDRESE